ncbi:HAD family hydrolase [Rubritalea marina]|uniref:HAD family hydrolase n=1 Tax=Rubritalea marina TaxID=361055 RepID=UPI001F0ABC02|nr:HAD family hydrolase [Rubritalea marina]
MNSAELATESSYESPNGYALFDLDQTLIPWDTQLLFCNYIIRKEPLRVLYILGFIPFLPFAKWLGPETMKRIFLNYLAGMDSQKLDGYARDFVDTLQPADIYDEIKAELDKHKEAGQLVILNSASPEIWVKYIAEKFEVDHYFGTRVDYGSRISLFPDIIGSNNKGGVKIKRMQHLFPEGWSKGDVLPNSSGYSDSHADLPMLMLCERNIMVHPTEKLLHEGELYGWKLMQPDRPTHNRFSFGVACLKQALGLYRS